MTLKFKREMEIELSENAVYVLDQTDYTIDEFLDWACERPRSFGDSDVIFFLRSKKSKD